MHVFPAWALLALAQPLPPLPRPPAFPPPAPPVVEVAPVSDPTDEEVLAGDKVPTDGAGLLDFFRQRVLTPSDETRIRGLVRQLGDDDFDRREDASAQLTARGLRAKPFLKAATADPDAEIAHRAGECLKAIDASAEFADAAAAVRVLARLRPAGAVEALLNYLPSAGDETLAEEVRLALATLAIRDGKPDPALVEALGDLSPDRRGAAAFALGRAKEGDPLPAVRKLLRDDDPVVRYRAALALAAARDRDAIPALIGVLDRLPRLEASRAEELLYRLADDKAPPAPGSPDPAARRQYRDDWKAWWDKHGDAVEDGRMAEAARTVGYTLIVLLDQGRVLELDSANQPRLKIDQLGFPLDAQLLPHDHVLAVEHNANRVTERDAQNRVVWECTVEGPLAAQRLPNGDTFIATRGQVSEVKPNGDEVFSYQRSNGDAIMKAQKLPDGDIALVTQLGSTRFVLLDNKGREKGGFDVDVKFSGGRIDVLPNGHVIVPESGNNRVVEMDEHGVVVWEAAAEQPIAAVRLANGDTLVTTFAEHRAVELDRDGKEVWEARRDTRVTRAFRR